MIPRKTLVSLALLLVSASSLWTQSVIEDSVQLTASRDWTIGTELDVFPYATGGWYASLFGGYKNIRIRGVVAKSFLPSFVRAEGIEEQRVNAYAGVVDFVFGPQFSEWWLGFGYEYWDTRYTSADGTADVTNSVLTVGGGYIWHFWKGFFLNPWVAAHVVLDATDRINVGSVGVTPAGVLPEVSLKLGWNL